jgi:diketogulonate reductase-like aldo/keto reductase
MKNAIEKKLTSLEILDIPLLGMGTWGMGGKFERDESNISQSIEILKKGFEIGYCMIDVAELYGQGLTETILGQAIASSNIPRKEFFIISKVSREHLAYADVHKAIEGSLERLNTDYIDLYLVHKENPSIPLSETMKAMEEISDQKLAHFIGVSNFDDLLVQKAQSYLDHTKISALEIEYNVGKRDAKKTTIPYCQENDIQIIAQSPFAKGALHANHDQLIDSLAEKYNKTAPQIMLNWLISQNYHPIPKTSSEKHLRENFGALGWELDEEDKEKLNIST